MIIQWVLARNGHQKYSNTAIPPANRCKSIFAASKTSQKHQMCGRSFSPVCCCHIINVNNPAYMQILFKNHLERKNSYFLTKFSSFSSPKAPNWRVLLHNLCSRFLIRLATYHLVYSHTHAALSLFSQSLPLTHFFSFLSIPPHSPP